MSTYLDYVIEKQFDNSKDWRFYKKSEYEDHDVPCPYILKGVLSDSDAFTSCASLDDLKDDKTIATFAQKLKRVNILQDKNRWSYEFDLKTFNSKNYPYKYTPRFEINEVPATDKGTIGDLQVVLNSLRSLLDYKFADTLIGIKLEGINKHLDTFIRYLSFDNDVAADIKDYMDLQKKILEKGDITPWLPNCESIIEYENNYYWRFDQPYEAIVFLKDYPIFKTVNADEVLNLSYGTIHYQNEQGVEVVQYELGYSPKISYPDDIKRLIEETENDIQRVKRSQLGENVAKNIIKEFLEDASPEDLETTLGKNLQEYVKDAIWEEDDEYLQELKSQKQELETLLTELGDAGRFIWSIS